jgi:hypothetical protein
MRTDSKALGKTRGQMLAKTRHLELGERVENSLQRVERT